MKVNENLKIQSVGDRVFITSKELAGDAYILNEISYQILKMVGDGKDEDTIIYELHQEYDVDKNELTNDIHEIIQLMKNHRIVLDT